MIHRGVFLNWFLLGFAVSGIGGQEANLRRDDPLKRTAAFLESKRVPRETIGQDLQFFRKLLSHDGPQKFVEKAHQDGIPKKEIPLIVACVWTELRIGPEPLKADEEITSDNLARLSRMLTAVKIESMPGEAQIFLRDEENYVGTTGTVRWVMPGKLRIILKLDGHETSDETIDVPKSGAEHKKTLRKK